MNSKQLILNYCRQYSFDFPIYNTKCIERFSITGSVILTRWRSSVKIPNQRIYHSSCTVLGTEEYAEDLVSRQLLDILTKHLFGYPTILKKEKNSKILLREFCDNYNLEHPSYHTAKIKHNKWTCQVLILSENCMIHSIKSDPKIKKKDAEDDAAKKMVEYLTKRYEITPESEIATFDSENDTFEGEYIGENATKLDDYCREKGLPFCEFGMAVKMGNIEISASIPMPNKYNYHYSAVIFCEDIITGTDTSAKLLLRDLIQCEERMKLL